MAHSKLAQIYDELKKAGERDSVSDDQDLAGLAESHYWRALKEVVLEPKINALYVLSEELTQVMTGQLDKEAFAERVIAARIAAGHLQDVIDKVEATHAALTDEQGQP